MHMEEKAGLINRKGTTIIDQLLSWRKTPCAKDFQGCMIRVRVVLIIVIIRRRMNCNTE